MADTYTVTGQRQTSISGPNGKLVRVMEVTFTTKPSGVESKIDIPVDQYSKTVAQAQLEQAAEQIEGVATL